MLPADDMQLLTARVRAADYNLIVSTAASDSLDGAIEILRGKGALGADLLIDALLIRDELSNFFGVPSFTLPAQRFDTLNEALGTASRYFGDGSRQQLKVVLPYAQRIYVFGEQVDAERLVDTALAQARVRTDGVISSTEYQDVNTERMTALCGTERGSEVLAKLWEAVAVARTAHGEHSLQLERQLDALGTCLNAVDDPSAGWMEEDIYAIAAARERPPSTHLMRRAEGAFNWAMSRRDVDAAERYYQSAVENSQAIVDPTLREGLTRRLAMNRVCLLAQRGDVDAAEQFSVPMVARFNAEFSQLGRLSPGQNNFWSCLSFAQRENGRYAEAVRTAQTIVERCRANKTAARIACEARPLREQALAELDWGRNTEALATMQERLKSARKLDGDPNAALVYGRALLANGRAQEAIEPLRMAYGSWLSVGQPNHVFAAEVEFWFGQAWIANGEVKRGRWMVAEAKRTLAQSPLPSHRALAAQPGP